MSILVLNYYSTFIKANTDMHYTITNINMNTPTNTNNQLAYIRIYKYTYRYNKQTKNIEYIKASMC